MPTSAHTLNLEETKRAAEVIKNLVAKGTQVVGLCEVDETSVMHVLRELSNDDLQYKVYDETTSNGRSRWDLALLYDKRFITRIGRRKIITARSGRSIGRAAIRYPLFLHEYSDPIYLYIAHWPSHLSEELSNTRRECGRALWGDIQELFESDTATHIMVMGDLNDEPFSTSVSEVMRSTRDPEMAKKIPILYNPFWGHLSGNFSDRDSAFGTVTYRGSETRWKTFDQILVSPSFLHGHTLQLREAIRYDEEYRIARQSGGKFDHIPIGISLNKDNQNE